jgi:hypothetical protein
MKNCSCVHWELNCKNESEHVFENIICICNDTVNDGYEVWFIRHFMDAVFSFLGFVMYRSLILVIIIIVVLQVGTRIAHYM